MGLRLVRDTTPPMTDRICEVCRADFTVPSSDINRRPGRFCSSECRVKGLSGNSLRPVKYKPTEEIDRLIKETYTSTPEKNQVKNLATRIGWPRWKVSRRAISLGLVQPKKKEPVWSEDELNILENNAHLTPEVIARKLRKAGFPRSATGILLKRKRMRFLSNLKGQSANDLAGCFGIDTHTVLRWIGEDLLKAEKRGTKRTEKQGGDIWFIRHKDIKSFIANNIHHVDIRKVDKYWLIDILTQP